MNKLTCVLVLCLAGFAFADELPYDDLVDYVEASSNTAYNTGLKAKTDMIVEADLAWLDVTGDQQIFGAINSNKDDWNKRMFGGMYAGAPYYICGNGATYLKPTFKVGMDGSDYANRIPGTVGLRHVCKYVLEDGLQEYWEDGVCHHRTTTTGAVNTDMDLFVFAYNTTSRKDGSGKVHARVYSLKIWQKDGTGDYVLLRDYKPASKDGIGVLYDAVNSNLATRVTGSDSVPRPVVDTNKPDRFIRWVQTGDGQYVDTGVAAKSNMAFEFDFAPLPGIYEEQTVFGARGTDNVRAYLVHLLGPDDGNGRYRVWAGYADTSATLTNAHGTTMRVIPNRRARWEGVMETGCQTITIDGLSGAMPTEPTRTTFESGLSLYLFACNVNGTAKYFSKVRFCGAKITRFGVLYRVFRPAVKNGRAGLWDEVSQQMYYPAGGKDFTLADDPDATPERNVTYVETDGGQFIDTGVIGRSGTRCEVVFSTVAAENDTVLGCVNTETGDAFSLLRLAGGPGGLSGQCIYGSDAVPVPGTIVASDTETRIGSDLAVGLQKFVCNGTTFSGTALNSVDTGKSLFLFARHKADATVDEADQFSKIRLYSAKIWQDGVLVRDYKPVLLSNGVFCLWERVANRYDDVMFSGHGTIRGKFGVGLYLFYK